MVAVDHDRSVPADEAVHRQAIGEGGALTDLLESLHGGVETLLVDTHRNDVVAHLVQQRDVTQGADDQRRVHPGADGLDDDLAHLRMTQQLNDLEINCEMP